MQTGRISDGERAEKVLDYYARLTPAERQELRRIRERRKGQRMMMLGLLTEHSQSAPVEEECYGEVKNPEHWTSWSKSETRKLQEAICAGRSWSECASLYPYRTRKAVRTKYYKVRAQLRQKGLIE